ncbi:MAG TPA: hypothetical protein VLF68_03260 [Candidatus Saccharimonadales bacterium]|nr:hypothetical protein [Candidatus Saccharimonadales bacterium]
MPDVFTSPPSSQPAQPDSSQIINQLTPPITEHHIHALAAFCQNPLGITFATQEEGETILLFLRRHFITNFPWIFISIVLLVVPTILHILFKTPFIAADNLFSFLPANFGTFFTLFYYLLIAMYIFINFITWYFNISMVTTIRIIDIDFSDVVYKNISATKLDLVQDVNYTQIGVIPSVFDYGDVLVQTAGSQEMFDFSSVPHPQRVVKIIEDLIGRRDNAV